MLIRSIHVRRWAAGLTAVLLFVTTGCTAWRDVTTGPEYRRISRLRQYTTQANLYRIDEKAEPATIFGTVQGLAWWEDESERIRAKQRGLYHKILRIPAGLAGVIYVVAVSPLIFVSYMMALPAWYDTGRDASFGQEPLYWEEYPWYWTTRGLWVIDFIFYDIPYVAGAWPVRIITRKPYEWEEEMELAPY